MSTYVSKGYSYSDVASGLLLSALLPAILEAIVLYFGIAFALFGIGMINNKLSVKSLIKMIMIVIQTMMILITK